MTDTIEVSVPEEISDLEGLLNEIAARLHHDIVESFDIGGPRSAPWKSTGYPRVAAMLAELDRTGWIGPRNFEQSHQTGVESGRLRDSVSVAVDDDGDIMIRAGGGEIDYAEKFHEGGESRFDVDQRALRAVYSGSTAFREHVQAHRLGWLFNKEFVTIKQPARPLFDRAMVIRAVEEVVYDFTSEEEHYRMGGSEDVVDLDEREGGR